MLIVAVLVCIVAVLIAGAVLALAVEISGWKGAVVVSAMYVLLAYSIGREAASAAVSVSPSESTGQIDQMIGRMRVPVVEGQQVIVGPCPTDPIAAGCTWYSPSAPIYVRQDDLASPVVLYFELGRRYWASMDVGERHRFLTLVSRRRWTSTTLAWFADAYAACALGQTPVDPVWHSSGFVSGYGYMPTPHVHRQVCGLIARAAG